LNLFQNLDEKKKLQILRLENDCKDIEKRLNQADKNVRNQGEIAAVHSFGYEY
jgi:hypothetical protein